MFLVLKSVGHSHIECRR